MTSRIQQLPALLSRRIRNGLPFTGLARETPDAVVETLLAHPAVAAAQVVGVETAAGFKSFAFVISKEGAGFDESSILAHCAARIAKFKVPVHVRPIDVFPVTPGANATKIQKAKLREIAQAVALGQALGLDQASRLTRDEQLAAVAGRLDARPVAQVRFTPGGATPDALFAHVLARLTNREVYAPRDVEPAKLAALAAAGTAFGTQARTCGNDDLAARLRDLTWRGHERESLTDYTMQESIDLMRIGPAEVAAHRDGLTLEGPVMGLGHLVGAVTRDTLADPDSAAFRQGLDMFRARAASARAFAWLTNDGADRTGQIAAGRAYMRLTLEAAGQGLAVHPWSQTLQEYPEMADLYDEVHTLVGGGALVQMLVRVGYAPPVVHAPRRGVDALFAA